MRQTKTRTGALACVKAEMRFPRVAESARTAKPKLTSKRAEALLETHRLHLGLYKRLADRLGVDASYISKVAGGTRECQSVMGTLLKELSEL